MAKINKEEAQVEEPVVAGTALTVLTQEEQAYLAARSKEDGEEEQFPGPPRLVINEVATDEEGNKRPVGGWHIKGTDVYFDGPAYLRPIRQANKLIRYNSDFTGIVGQSIYFNDFRDEILDSLGGLALGRKFGKNFSAEEKEVTKKLAEVYSDIFGLVRFGNDTTQHPVVYRVRGMKIKVTGDAFQAVPKDKKYWYYEYKLETYQGIDEKTKQRNKYWSLKVTPDMSKVLPLTPIMAFDKEIVELMAADNARVVQQHKGNRNKVAERTMAKEASAGITATILPPIDKDLNDELPF